MTIFPTTEDTARPYTTPMERELQASITNPLTSRPQTRPQSFSFLRDVLYEPTDPNCSHAETKISVLSQTRSSAARDSQEHKWLKSCGCDRRSAPVLLPTCDGSTVHLTGGPIQQKLLMIVQERGHPWTIIHMTTRIYTCNIRTPNTLTFCALVPRPAHTFRGSDFARHDEAEWPPEKSVISRLRRCMMAAVIGMDGIFRDKKNRRAGVDHHFSMHRQSIIDSPDSRSSASPPRSL